MRYLKHLIIRWLFKRATREFDRRLAQARKAHKPTRHIQRAKYAAVHSALAQKVGR